MARRTKIVATIGPASASPETLRALIEAGMDVARINLAHGDPRSHARTAEAVRDASEATGRLIPLLADLPGPKMRTGELAGGEVQLREGQRFRLVSGNVPGDATTVSTTLDDLERLVSKGDDVFLADGQIVLSVVSTAAGVVETEVIRGGILRSGKGMHVPGAEGLIAAFPDSDADALATAVSLGVDLVGLSFVRSADEIRTVRSLLSTDAYTPLLVAKVETRAAIANLSEIVAEADALMVARGDLGIQLRLQEVPVLQKQAIRACNRAAKPVITATQMMESMTHSPLPTRAEVTDVANAVFDGTDALMLSEETAVGAFPVAAVRAMAEIAEEADLNAQLIPPDVTASDDDPISWAIGRAAVQVAEEVSAAVIVCPTRTGTTARRVAAFRPTMPILALDHRPETLRPLGLVRGIVSQLVPFVPERELPTRGVDRALQAVNASGLAASGDRIVLVAGGFPHRETSTDLVRVLSL